MLQRTNPEYARLAYRRAILIDVMRQLQRAYLPTDASPAPARKLVCDAVLASDAEVPAEAFQEFLAELHSQAEVISLEMTEYDFTRKTHGHSNKQEPSPKKSDEKPAKKGRSKSVKTA